MGEKLKAKRVSLSLAAVVGILSILCALLIAIAPSAMVNFFGLIFHGIDVSQIEKQMTLGGAIIGTVEVIVIGLIAGWLFTVVYNKMR